MCNNSSLAPRLTRIRHGEVGTIDDDDDAWTASCRDSSRGIEHVTHDLHGPIGPSQCGCHLWPGLSWRKLANQRGRASRVGLGRFSRARMFATAPCRPVVEESASGNCSRATLSELPVTSLSPASRAHPAWGGGLAGAQRGPVPEGAFEMAGGTLLRWRRMHKSTRSVG